MFNAPRENLTIDPQHDFKVENHQVPRFRSQLRVIVPTLNCKYDIHSSRAFIAEDTETEALVVLKFSKMSMSVALKKESSVLSFISHENVIKMQDYLESIEIEISNKKTMRVAMIALEFAANGDLLSLLQKKARFPEKLARTYFSQIIDALSHLHKNNIAHRDIKPENLLLDSDFCLKLSDFGFAEKLTPGQKSLKTVGTPAYFAPELHDKLPHCARSTDLFAAGMILFIMLTGNMPFEIAHLSDKTYRLLVRQKTEKFWNFHESVVKCQSSDFRIDGLVRDLLTKMWEIDPEKRLTIKEIQAHEWLQGEIFEKEQLEAFMTKFL